jgi:hypothetical protein
MNTENKKALSLTLITDKEQKTRLVESSDIHIGDLVVLKTHPYFKDNRKNNIYNADPQTIPPAMVVVEVIKDLGKDTIKYDEETGQKISGSLFKYRCQFYSSKEGKFKEFLLIENVLGKIDVVFYKKHTIKDLKLYSIGLCVELKTFMFEIRKQKSSTIKLKDSTETIEGINKTTDNGITQITIDNEVTISPLLSHLPPSLVVTGIEKNKDTNGIYRTKADGSRETIREVSLYKIKCMWYNPIDCKFSEEWFIPEALISIEEK